MRNSRSAKRQNKLPIPAILSFDQLSLEQKSKVDHQKKKRSMVYQFVGKFVQIRPRRSTSIDFKSTLKLCKLNCAKKTANLRRSKS